MRTDVGSGRITATSEGFSQEEGGEGKVGAHDQFIGAMKKAIKEISLLWKKVRSLTSELAVELAKGPENPSAAGQNLIS